MTLDVTFVDDVSSLDLSSSYADLMEAAYGSPAAAWAKVFKPKHQENPFGGSYAGLIFDSGRLVAMNLFWKWQFVRGTEVLNAAQSCDSAVRPEHQGKGLFSRIQKIAMEKIPAHSIRFGLPNSNSAPGFRKLGWSFRNEFRTYIFVSRFAPFVVNRAIYRRHSFRAVEPEPNPGRDPQKLNAFFSRIKQNSAAWMTNFSAELVEWRLRLGKHLGIEIILSDAGVVGVLFYKLAVLADTPSYRMIFIVNLIYDETADGAIIRTQLQTLLDKLKVSEIQTSNTKASELIARFGLKVRSKSMDLILHPSYGWRDELSMKKFVSLLRLTLFDSDHI